MQILFMGTPDFAVSALKAIVEAGHGVTSVITQPDKPKGRGHKMAHPPVYEYAEAAGLKIHQPEILKNNGIADILESEKPELIIVVAYGKILPEYVLNYPKYGCVNVHASLLPKYRGAAPIQRCIIDGESVTGVTTMYMAKGLDTGDMIEKISVDIDAEDDFEALHDKLADAGSRIILSTISKIESGTAEREVQDDALSTYAEMITKETARICWSKNAKDIYNLIRGLHPVPKAFTFLGDTQMKITRASYVECTEAGEHGSIVYVEGDCIRILCGENSALDVHELQPQGKRVMPVKEYLKGNKLSVGDRFE